MCGRYGFIPPHDFYKRFRIIDPAEFELRPNYNAAPGEVMPVITAHSPKQVHLMKWGLIPHWAKDPRIGYKMINARAEGIDQKPSFRGPVKNKRCLVPSSGFFEWSRQGGIKHPYFFQVKDWEIFAFAGLYDVWTDSEGKQVKTYTIITTRANSLVGRIHDRMPVILDRDCEDVWADNSGFDPAKLLPLLTPFPADRMISYRVSDLVNDPANNSPELLRPVDPSLS